MSEKYIENTPDEGESEPSESQVVDFLWNMFDGEIDKDVILTVVESCDGDVQNSTDALMHMRCVPNRPDTPPLDPQINWSQCQNQQHPQVSQEPQMVPNINMAQDQDVAHINPYGALNPFMEQNPYVTHDPYAEQNQNIPQEQNMPHLHMPSQSNHVSDECTNDGPTLSYASSLSKTGAIPKTSIVVNHKIKNDNYPKFWTEQLKTIVSNHFKGYRILIIMRGPPGCGKSYLSNQIIKRTVGADVLPETHIFSSDDYFVKGKFYNYDRDKLADAHNCNQIRVDKALRAGLSPVIVDNTNIEIWEMQPYIATGVENGYIIELVTPKTSWARNTSGLFQRNTHNVPFKKIKSMQERFDSNTATAEDVIKQFNLTYPDDKIPPVMRNYPEIFVKFENSNNQSAKYPTPTVTHDSEQPVCSRFLESELTNNSNKGLPLAQLMEHADKLNWFDDSEEHNKIVKENRKRMNRSNDDSYFTEQSHNKGISKDKGNSSFKNVENALEEFEKLEKEWEMGDEWEGETEKTEFLTKGSDVHSGPKPKRNVRHGSELLMNATNVGNDWNTNITQFMKPFTPDVLPVPTVKAEVSKESKETAMETSEINVHNMYKFKILYPTARDINLHYKPPAVFTIPAKTTFDKSTSTNDEPINGNRCRYEEHHFLQLRRMFRKIPRSDLRDIFDRCQGDVNWAHEIIMDGVYSNQIEELDTDCESDCESCDDDVDEQTCDCLARYGIVPNIDSQVNKNADVVPAPDEMPQRLPKREKVVSETSLQVKKQIEDQVAISEHHYSQQTLRVRHSRHGNVASLMGGQQAAQSSSNNETENSMNNEIDLSLPGSSVNFTSENLQNPRRQNSGTQLVKVTFGKVLINELDRMYGRSDTLANGLIKPTAIVTLDVMDTLNACWIESFTCQAENTAPIVDPMHEEEIELERKLAEKAAEMSRADQEPEVPDLKEIMDLELAITIYQREANEEWKNKEPNDIAARMTREKLYNLFPDVPRDTLAEMLVAHNNNFQNTVEVLLTSTGQGAVLEQKNGLNKFVMEKEIARQEKRLAEEKQKADEQWPALTEIPEEDERLSMEDVLQYRAQAQNHLDIRSQHLKKANEFLNRSMTSVASYYFDVASLHKKKFEEANVRAATALLNVHCQDSSNTVLDLHQHYVPEALAALDMFLDFHIRIMRESRQGHGGSSNSIFIITGRGKHSPNGPKIKPAVSKRLKERGFELTFVNPGSLTVAIRGDEMLTHDFKS